MSKYKEKFYLLFILLELPFTYVGLTFLESFKWRHKSLDWLLYLSTE